jgi:Transcriptional regulatory protein, C terminal
VQGGVAVPVRGAKQRALLALVALHRGKPVSADRLIDHLWGDGEATTERRIIPPASPWCSLAWHGGRSPPAAQPTPSSPPTPPRPPPVLGSVQFAAPPYRN